MSFLSSIPNLIIITLIAIGVVAAMYLVREVQWWRETRRRQRELDQRQTVETERQAKNRRRQLEDRQRNDAGYLFNELTKLLAVYKEVGVSVSSEFVGEVNLIVVSA